MKETNLREKNENIANIYVSRVMAVCAGFTGLALVLNLAGLFVLDMKVMLIACTVGIIVMMMPTILIRVLKINSPWLKYFAIICACTFVLVTSATLGPYVVIMGVFPMALACIYFDPKLNIFALILGCISAGVGQILPRILGTTIDNNYDTLKSELAYGLPAKILMLMSIGYIFISLGKNTNQMMGSLMDAEEQDKMFLHMKNLTNKSLEVSQGLSSSVETLTNVTQQTKRNNEEISNQTNVVVNGIHSSMEQLNVAGENSISIYDSVRGLAAESEEIGVLFENVEKISEENKAYMQSVTAGMEIMHENTDVCYQAMQQLEEKTRKIDGIVGTITDISDQTDLLALNAAIESARAGEQGKGFAVVADEIRKLSQQTQRTLDDIKAIIGEVLEQNSIAMSAMNQTSSANAEQKNVIIKAEESAQSVTIATKEMTKKMHVIIENTKHIEGSTGQIADIVNMITKICQENQESLELVSASLNDGEISMNELESLVRFIHEMSDELSVVVESK